MSKKSRRKETKKEEKRKEVKKGGKNNYCFFLPQGTIEIVKEIVRVQY